MDLNTSLSRARPLATAAGALATLTASLSVVPLFDSGRWIIPTIAGVLTMALTGAVARAVGLPPPLQPILQVLVLLTLLTVMFVQPAAALGIFPGPVALTELQELTRIALVEAESALAPVPTTSVLILLAVGGISLVALLVDTIGVTLRLPALAGFPLLLVYALPAAVVPGGVPWWLLPLSVIGWLLLLAADARDDARNWGPLLRRRPATSTGPRAHPRSARPRVSSGVAAIQVTLVALIAALVLPTVIPGLSEPVWVSPSGNRPGGSDGDGPVSVDPFVSLRRDLVDNPDRELLRYRATNSSPGYLRLVSLDEFDGVTWRASQTPVRVPATDALGPPDLPGVEDISEAGSDIRITDLDNPHLPVPYAASLVTGVDEPLDARWTWDPPTRTVGGVGVSSRDLSYRVTSYDVEPSRAELRAATRRAPDTMLASLQLPDSLTPELALLAAEVTANAQTPYAKAEALIDFFTEDGGFSYSTNVVTPPGADPLQSFLDERIGYCQQFAGTMALMARAVGIPSRVVVGFTSGRLTDDGEYVVQARNAHAWPELWFTGIGWTWFEPTPRVGAGVAQPNYSRDRAEGADRNEDLPEDAPLPETPDAQTPAAGAPTSDVAPRLALALLTLLLVLLAAPLVVIDGRRRRRTAAAEPRTRIESTWRELSDSITDLGWPWSRAATPREAANSLARHISLDEDQRAALRRLVWWVEQVRYAPPDVPFTPPTSAELRADLATVRHAAQQAATRGQRLRARLIPASLLGGNLRTSSIDEARQVERV